VSRWLSEPDRLNSGYSLLLKQYKELPLDSHFMKLLQSDRAPADLDRLRHELDRLPTRQVLTLVEQDSGIEVQPQDVGVGLSQLIPVVTLLLSRTGDAVIEHPELNLHPRLQAELGDVLIEGALSKTTGGRTFFIETHSEHLTLRVLRRIRESTRGQARFGIAVKPTDVGVWYVDRSAGAVTVKQILVDVEGEFVQPWPEDDTLFEQDFRERYA
jgi:predicted ATPase